METCLLLGGRSLSEFTCDPSAHATVIVHAQIPGRIEVLGDCGDVPYGRRHSPTYLGQTLQFGLQDVAAAYRAPGVPAEIPRLHTAALLS